MHISEGVLESAILLPSAAITGAFLVANLIRVKPAQIPKIACMSAIFFIASFIHVPLGPASIHLILSGIVGTILGFDAILAIFVGLLFQGLFFGYGGVAVLGVNSLIIAFPAVFSRQILKFTQEKVKWRNLGFFLCGFLPVLLSSVLLSLILVLNGDEFVKIANLIFVYNLILAIIEGIIALFCLNFIFRVKREILC